MTASVPEAMRDLFDEPALAHVSYLNDGATEIATLGALVALLEAK